MDPKALVRKAEVAYQSQDAEEIMELFDPEIVVYWDGKKRWETHADVRAHHAEPIADLPEFEIRKSLRAASGDTIAVEWTNTLVEPDGTRVEGFGSEIWMLHDDRLREWHVYYQRYDEDELGEGGGEDAFALTPAGER